MKLRCPLSAEGDTRRTLVAMLIVLDAVSTKNELAMKLLIGGFYRDKA